MNNNQIKEAKKAVKATSMTPFRWVKANYVTLMSTQASINTNLRMWVSYMDLYIDLKELCQNLGRAWSTKQETQSKCLQVQISKETETSLNWTKHNHLRSRNEPQRIIRKMFRILVVQLLLKRSPEAMQFGLLQVQ